MRPMQDDRRTVHTHATDDNGSVPFPRQAGNIPGRADNLQGEGMTGGICDYRWRIAIERREAGEMKSFKNVPTLFAC